MYELSGRIRRLGEQQTFASGFTKREVVVEQPGGERGPVPVPVVFKNDDVVFVCQFAYDAKFFVCQTNPCRIVRIRI